MCQYKYNYSLYVSICVNVKVFFEVAWWASIGFTGYQDLQRNIYRIDYRGCFSQCFRLKWGWNPKHAALGSLGSLGEEKTMAPNQSSSTFHPPPRTSPDRRPKKKGPGLPQPQGRTIKVILCQTATLQPLQVEAVRNSWEFTSPKNG